MSEENLDDRGGDREESIEFTSSFKAVRAPASYSVSSKRQPPDWPIYIIGWATFLSGLLGTVKPLVTRLAIHHPKLLLALVPYEYYDWSKSLTVAFGVLLIYVSINLFRRKKMAWLLAVIGNSLSILIDIARLGAEHLHGYFSKYFDPSLPTYSCIPAIVTLALLFAYRQKFIVESERATIKAALAVIALSALTMLVYGSLGFFLLDRRDFGVNFQLTDAIIRTIRQMTFLGNPDLIPNTRYARWFLDSLQVYGGSAAVLGSLSLFRPLNYRLNTLPHERALAETILNDHGRTSLDSYKLLSDKSYFFSPERRSFVAYRGAWGVAVVLGDPVGPQDDLSTVTSLFRDMCHRNGWACAFLQTTPELAEMFESLGFDSLKVGEDAVVDLSEFTSQTVKKKTFKAPAKKFEKDGFKVVRHAQPHAADLLNTVHDVSQEWLALPGRRERGFSLGAFNREELNRTPIYTLADQSGKTLAFVNQVRSYREGEATIDLMRHRKDVPNGAMDFLFVKLLTMLKEEGFTHFSLGLAALSGVGTTPDAPLEERAAHQIYEHMNRFFSYKGLRNYKDKFDPRWEERFLIYEGGPPGLIKAAMALAKVTEG